LNDNRRFDTNAVRADWGNAGDVVVYTVTANFPRLFPVAGLIGLSNTVSLSSTKMVRIQPFGVQTPAMLRSC
jgi:hypothetical protein